MIRFCGAFAGVNWSHPLFSNGCLSGWWMGLPGGQWSGGAYWRDLCRWSDAQLFNFSNPPTSTSGWLTKPKSYHGNYALAFDMGGSPEYGRVTYSPKFDLSSVTAYTISVWAYYPGAVWNSDAALASQFRNSPSNYTGWMLWTNGSGMHLYINSGSRVSYTMGAAGWHHIVGAWDGSTVYLYDNGALQASASYATAPNTTTQDVTIGGYHSNGNDTGGAPAFPFHGYLDDLMIWRGKCLNASEVKLLHQSGLTGHRSLLRWHSPWSVESGASLLFRKWVGANRAGSRTLGFEA